ncbi:MAG: hypothetical protein O7D86_14345 [Proteobacteria bacterium]|nr:hypothetical protein [Pseudomonadota bacterium]
MVCSLKKGTGFILYLSGEYAYSLYSTRQNAYRLPAKNCHRVAMTEFLGGALNILVHTLKRVITMDGEYSAFAGAKSCLLQNLEL